METKIFWQTIQNNDARFDGAFVYGVNSTKIYCKPSCATRLPKPENVRFFASTETAEARGFRACLRCEPKNEKANPQTEIVLRACELLESEEQVSLETLSAEVHLSPTHLQKLFKEIIGVSPKKFAESKRLEKFKSELKHGNDVVKREVMKKEVLENQIAEIFDISQVKYINIRNSEAGCFVARIERL